MDERAALELVAEEVAAAGDDAAVIDGLVLTTDMLHASTDFPDGTTRYTAGWRTVGASLSDLAGMGADATAALAVYAAPTFVETELRGFLRGATAVCDAVDATYVGGDLDQHAEFTAVSTAVGSTNAPVFRDGATAGDGVYVTGTLGRTAAALRRFEAGETERANELFRFHPRIQAGVTLAEAATAMMDISDGLARSAHQLAAASACGLALERDAIPIDSAVDAVAGSEERIDLGMHVGEDFELLLTGPPAAIRARRERLDVPLTRIGEVTADGVYLDEDPLPDRGYTHGTD